MAKDHLDVKTIIGRVNIGKEFLKEFVDIDVDRSRAFLDSSVVPVYLSDEGDTVNITSPEIQSDVPIGQSNLLTASLLVKLAVVAINRPDWHVTAQKKETDEQGNVKMVSDPESALIWRQYMRDEWDKKNWQRVALLWLLKRYVCGLGTIHWSWDDTGCELENVQSWDLRVDPYLTNWQNPKYGGIRIRMSLREAADRYPKGPFKDLIAKPANKQADTQKIEVEIYWDKDTEGHVYQDKLLEHKDVAKNSDPKSNLYERVPLLFLEGDLHPGKTPFPLGDSILAAGAQAELSDLNQSVSNTAKAGAGWTVVDTAVEGVNETVLEAIEKGDQQQVIGIKGARADDPPIFRIPGEELRPAVITARQEAKDDLISLLGISNFDLGLMSDHPQFATQVAVTAQKGGARQNQAKAEYETGLNRLGSIVLWLFQTFGGPWKHPETGVQMASDEHVALHEAAMNVTEVKVIENSTSYKDPSVQQQQSMQLFNTVAQHYPLLVSLADMGLMVELPDMKNILDRVFRSFDMTNTDKAWRPYQAQPKPQEPQKSIVPYQHAPEDIKRQLEQKEGLQPSQLGSQDNSAAETTLGHHMTLESQAREHLKEIGLQQMKQLHEEKMAKLHSNGKDK